MAAESVSHARGLKCVTSLTDSLGVTQRRGPRQCILHVWYPGVLLLQVAWWVILYRLPTAPADGPK